MKRILCAGIFLFLLLSGAALAESQLICSGVVSPSELVVPGEVTLTLSITNNSPQPARGVVVYGAGETEGVRLGGFEVIGAYELVEIKTVYNVTKEQLDNGIILVWTNHEKPNSDDPNDVQIGNIGIPITKVNADPRIEFTRQMSSEKAQTGETVTVVYSVKNAGNVELRQITVMDDLGGFDSRVSLLKPGESATFLNRVKIEGECASNARVSYTPLTENSPRTVSLISANIDIVTESLTVEATSELASVAYGGMININIEVINSGTTEVRGITLADQTLGSFAIEPFALMPGESRSLVREMAMYSRRVFVITASGTSVSGNQVSGASEGVEVAVDAVTDTIDMTLAVTPGTYSINRAGGVEMEISLANNGGSCAYDVDISEASLGVIRNIGVLALGEPTVFKYVADIDAARTLNFTASARDDSDELATARANPVRITIDANGAEPILAQTPDAQSVVSGASSKLNTSNVYPYMIAGGLALLATLIVTLAVINKREYAARRAARKKREEAKKK